MEFEGAWYHVMNRGAWRRAVFISDEQRQDFLSLLPDAYDLFNTEWHAYCLMDTHDHLLIRTPVLISINPRQSSLLILLEVENMEQD